MKKSIVVGIILLFLLSSLIPITSSYSSYETNKAYTIHIDENGTLSGYVKDTSMNPIEGAKVQVYFHETYEENYTDASGYYNVSNIPICWCLKNATASKEGYTTEWVLLAIGENTTYDFVLTPLGKTLYVGGSGVGNYTTIQSAIDAASNGDTIFVYNGIYTEHILIDKTITLMGEDKDTTIINSRLRKDIVQVFDTDNVTISGFMIQNTLDYSEYMAAVHIKNTSNTMILQNILTGCYDGILLKSSYNNIINNSIRDNKNGICFGHYRDGRVFIKGNTGDVAHGFSHIKNSITGNEITKNTEAGLALSFTMGNNISANNISNNGIGIRLRDCSNNIVQYNNFIDNMLNAFDMLQNQWDMNYWDNWIGLKISILDFLPYYIPGTLFANLDFHPAQEPHDMGG